MGEIDFFPQSFAKTFASLPSSLRGQPGLTEHMGLSRGGCLPGSKFDPDVMVLPGSRLLRIDH